MTLPHIALYALAALLLGLLMAGTALLIRATGRFRNKSNTTNRAPSAAATTG